ncbi:MAG TPA: TlpA disulfide reductase family protein [Candidatus Binataceae bacterium]|jgi:peroxiredoxin|nr:TlpA disulfide reductase family protein [Candidatus Binataceae bacterium]
MTRRVKTLSAIAGLAIATALILAALARSPRTGPTAEQVQQAADKLAHDEGAPIAAGEPAASFKLTDLAGRTVSLASLRGKVIFLNIWATWCAPCREEMPSMEKLYERLRGNHGFVMLAVSQDTGGRQLVADYVKKHGYQFDVLLDPQNAVADAYRISGVPETFIIDRQGRIVAHHSGAFDWSQPEIRTAIEELLAQGKG